MNPKGKGQEGEVVLCCSGQEPVADPSNEHPTSIIELKFLTSYVIFGSSRNTLLHVDSYSTLTGTGD
jgi:hypothetical protein